MTTSRSTSRGSPLTACSTSAGRGALSRPATPRRTASSLTERASPAALIAGPTRIPISGRHGSRPGLEELPFQEHTEECRSASERGESRSPTTHLQQTQTDADRQETQTDPTGRGRTTSIEREEFDLDEDEPFKATRQDRTFDWFVAKSLGPHWSAGLIGNVEASTFSNKKFSTIAAPTIEYSVFPYQEYATRQLRLQYALGVAHARYNEITLYDKLDETHPVHEASVTLDRREPWGSVDLTLEFSQYLHDLSKYRLELDGEASFRITRGLSFNLEGGISRIRDQLSLPRRDATQEEVLLRLNREHGVALLIAEKNLDFAASITHRAYIMEKGRIAHSTSREELLADKQRLHELLGV